MECKYVCLNKKMIKQSTALQTKAVGELICRFTTNDCRKYNFKDGSLKLV